MNSPTLEAILLQFFHDQYEVRNLMDEMNGKPNKFVKEGEKIDQGQKSQAQANVNMIVERCTAAGITGIVVKAEPESPHLDW